MIRRRLSPVVLERLRQFPAVALLGPRQAGKTTLALDIARQVEESGGDSLYLDLESPADRDKLSDPELYLESQAERLVVLDEIQRMPELFQSLRSLIDRGRRRGLRTGRFLILGSASIDLLRQSGESLAGRIAYLELAPFDVLEAAAETSERLWVRGGFPDSFLAPDDSASAIWRENFIRTYLERDIPQLGPRIPAETLRRFWTMLAHNQGQLLNAARLGRSLAVDGKSVARYLDLMVDLLLVRRLPPFHGNVGKRLVKAPKTYVRDSGILHSLLALGDREALFGHPTAGDSWEGFAIENILGATPEHTQACFYRSAAGAEIDLVLDLPAAKSRGERWAVEIKRGLVPKLERGFHHARADLQPDRCYLVYSGQESYPKGDGVETISLPSLCARLSRYQT